MSWAVPSITTDVMGVLYLLSAYMGFPSKGLFSRFVYCCYNVLCLCEASVCLIIMVLVSVCNCNI